MKPYCLRWAAGLVLIMTAVSARAAIDWNEDRTVSLGGRATYFDPKDGDDVWAGGAQLRLFFAPALALEGSIDYRKEEFDVIDVDIFPVQASLLAYLLPARPFGVFLLGGGGWYYTRIDPPAPFDDDTDHRFGWHAGAGSEVVLNEYWSIDATYRYLWLEDIESVDQNLQDKDFEDSGSMVTIALNYLF